MTAGLAAALETGLQRESASGALAIHGSVVVLEGNNQTDSAAPSSTNRALSVLLHGPLQLVKSKLVPRFTSRYLSFSSCCEEGCLFLLVPATEAASHQTPATRGSAGLPARRGQKRGGARPRMSARGGSQAPAAA